MGKHRSLEQQLADAEAKADKVRERQRSARTRRLIVTGAAMEAWAGDDPGRQQELRAILDRHVRSKRDRKAVGLLIDHRQTE